MHIVIAAQPMNKLLPNPIFLCLSFRLSLTVFFIILWLSCDSTPPYTHTHIHTHSGSNRKILFIDCTKPCQPMALICKSGADALGYISHVGVQFKIKLFQRFPLDWLLFANLLLQNGNRFGFAKCNAIFSILLFVHFLWVLGGRHCQRL